VAVISAGLNLSWLKNGSEQPAKKEIKMNEKKISRVVRFIYTALFVSSRLIRVGGYFWWCKPSKCPDQKNEKILIF